MANVTIPGTGTVIKGGVRKEVPVVRKADMSKPKVRKDGTPDPGCIECQKKKQPQEP